MSIAELNRKLDSLEEQITKKNISAITFAQKKLENTNKYANVDTLFKDISRLTHLLDLSCSEITPEAMNQLAVSIEPIVQQIAPYMDKVQSLEKYSHLGELENMIEKKKDIQKLATLNRLQYEKAQNLGQNTGILLAHYNAIIDNLSRDFAVLEAQLSEVEDLSP
ncbi:Oidioi.mRNA.OKI2018_I69.chr2.g7591.t1.cds [Oikopleura dioica]|uniref:Oidioi.mRNA.OKI2018_I69.chr2.g7591.t1.cds n=1 Tax=Oikopleura dioica TaxID=34765 RepID=A0ABN7TBA4_OIKDI|nr:Oidioi.mRNA.OKI2018_I69.chr2.g7591.t1.cds [Oikopleura dioica]